MHPTARRVLAAVPNVRRAYNNVTVRRAYAEHAEYEISKTDGRAFEVRIAMKIV